MKKSLLFLALVPFLFSACYEGPYGDREEYTVSGYVYYPDSITPLVDAHVGVIDITFKAHWDGVHNIETLYNGRTDENGYFEIVIPDGGKFSIDLTADYFPPCDTAEIMYHYHGDMYKRYSGRHCFENLHVYTYIKEHPVLYPYCDPSYPFIGDSVRIAASNPIQRIELIEERTTCIFAMDYQEPDTSVMFFIPDFVSMEKYNSLCILVENGVCGIPLHLRQHNNNIQKPSLQ